MDKYDVGIILGVVFIATLLLCSFFIDFRVVEFKECYEKTQDMDWCCDKFLK